MLEYILWGIKAIGYNWLAVGIAILALLISILKDFILPLVFRPIIEIEWSNDIEECIEDAIGHPNVKSRWLHLRIINLYSFTSITPKNIYIKLLDIFDQKGKRINPFNSFLLPWVIYDTNRNDLAKGESHLVDLVNEVDSFNRIEFKALNNGKVFEPLPPKLKNSKKLGPGDYSLRIGIYGDNIKSRTEEIKIRLHQNFGKLCFLNEKRLKVNYWKKLNNALIKFKI